MNSAGDARQLRDDCYRKMQRDRLFAEPLVEEWVEEDETLPMDLATVLAGLYASEINFSIRAFYDEGIEVVLGDDLNGIRAARIFCPDDMPEAARWLHEAAVEQWPDSEYARKAQSS